VVTVPEKSSDLGNSCSCAESIDRICIQTRGQTNRPVDRVLRIRTGTSDCYKDYQTSGELYGYKIKSFPAFATVLAARLRATAIRWAWF